jgi:hypothetical protein
MGALKKATIYFDPDLHKAARVHAAGSDTSVSDIVNDALSAYFSELDKDLKDIKKRTKEPRLSMESVLKKLKSDGLI